MLFKIAVHLRDSHYIYVHAKLLQLCLTLCDPMDCSLPGSSVHGILQARILEWVPCPPPGHLPDPGIEPASLNISCTGRQVIYMCTYLHFEVSFFLFSLNERFFKFYSALQFSKVSHMISYLLKCFFGHTPRHVGSKSLIRHQTCVLCIGGMES